MFRHWGAIFRDSTNTKYYVCPVVFLKKGTTVSKHVGVIFFMKCVVRSVFYGILWSAFLGNILLLLLLLLFFWRDSPQCARASSFTSFLDHIQRRTTFGSTPLDDVSARLRDLYLTKHNNHNTQTSMPRWDSNPQTQQASGRSPTPYTARPLGPA